MSYKNDPTKFIGLIAYYNYNNRWLFSSAVTLEKNKKKSQNNYKKVKDTLVTCGSMLARKKVNSHGILLFFHFTRISFLRYYVQWSIFFYLSLRNKNHNNEDDEKREIQYNL